MVKTTANLCDWQLQYYILYIFSLWIPNHILTRYEPILYCSFRFTIKYYSACNYTFIWYLNEAIRIWNYIIFRLRYIICGMYLYLRVCSCRSPLFQTNLPIHMTAQRSGNRISIHISVLYIYIHIYMKLIKYMPINQVNVAKCRVK